MKIVTANGKKTVKMSKSEWQTIGKQSGWMKIAEDGALPPFPQNYQPQQPIGQQAQQPQQTQTQPQQAQAKPNYSVMTFNKLMQDPNFKTQYQNLQNQKKWKQQIYSGWQKLGINMSFPEIVDLFN